MPCGEMLRDVNLFNLKKKRLWGGPSIHTRKLSRKQSQALHSSAWREGGVRNRKEQIGPEKKGFRLGVRKIFVSVRVVKQ